MALVKNEEYLIDLGLTIKQLRLSKKMTQLELSIDSGVPLSQIGAIESGKLNTTVKTLKKISDSLNVKTKELFTF